jgi:PAP2 superfamily
MTSRRLVAFFGVSGVLLVPWTVGLAHALPCRYVSAHWGIAWAGFDTALAVGLALTAFALHRRMEWLDRVAIATATLLAADAWFDVLTAGSGTTLAVASAEALLVELPTAALCIWVARRFTAPPDRTAPPRKRKELRMKQFSPRLFAAGLVLGALGTAAVLAASAFGGTPDKSVASVQAPTTAQRQVESGQPVIDWNQILLSIVNTPGAQPANIQPTRNFAIVHAAIYDAVNAIDRTHQPYLVDVRAPRDASETAAADAAAHTALVGLYPAEQGMLDADYAAELGKVADGPAKDHGVKLGEQVATDLLAIRANDGSSLTAPPFVPGTGPGDFNPALTQPPNFPAPVFTGWGQVTPFVLESASQFRPAPPPALTSDAYAAAINEVQSLGSATSTTRTEEQTEIGKFWNPPIQNFWNQIAEEVATAHHSDLATTARLFAALNLSFADSAIAFYDAKYTYHLWRPVTAIHLAGTDGNPSTVADPSWVPLAGNTPADPSYPGAHSTISAAGADVLASFFGDQQSFSVTSPALPGVTRSFDSFGAAANEAGLSRIYAGVHTRLDHVAGLTLGHDVASFVLHNALLPAHDSSGK